MEHYHGIGHFTFWFVAIIMSPILYFVTPFILGEFGIILSIDNYRGSDRFDKWLSDTFYYGFIGPLILLYFIGRAYLSRLMFGKSLIHVESLPHKGGNELKVQVEAKFGQLPKHIVRTSLEEIKIRRRSVVVKARTKGSVLPTSIQEIGNGRFRFIVSLNRPASPRQKVLGGIYSIFSAEYRLRFKVRTSIEGIPYKIQLFFPT